MSNGITPGATWFLCFGMSRHSFQFVLQVGCESFYENVVMVPFSSHWSENSGLLVGSLVCWKMTSGGFLEVEES